MNWFSRDKERERYYLLPGQGARSMQRKRKLMLRWAVAVGLLVSLGLALLFFWINSLHG
jgi:hypothetical protein